MGLPLEGAEGELRLMLGPQIIVRSLSIPSVDDVYRNRWQYHSRSDRHSKVACWAILFDLLRSSAMIRAHALAGKIGFGINHEMTDFSAGRHKNLDLVICVPRSAEPDPVGDVFSLLPDSYGIALTDSERNELNALPPLANRAVGDVLVAMEAKAAMTKHTGAGPRFNDELTSAFQCINGSAQNAIAVGFGMVNAASEFISPDSNRKARVQENPIVNSANQPGAAQHIAGRMRGLRVRALPTEGGFDALGLLTISMRNDGSPVLLLQDPPAVASSDSLHYEMMIRRIASLYEVRFATR